MMYQLLNGQLEPLSDGEIRAQNPDVIFPRNLTNRVRERFGAIFPDEGSRSEGQVLDTITQVNGVWVKQWRDKTAQEAADALTAKRNGMRVSRLQARLALTQAGLWGSIQGAIDNISDTTQRATAQAYFDEAQTWRRSSPFIASIGAALNQSDAQIDALFEAAAAIDV